MMSNQIRGQNKEDLLSSALSVDYQLDIVEVVISMTVLIEKTRSSVAAPVARRPTMFFTTTLIERKKKNYFSVVDK